jgi:hypothetical protein
VSFCAPVLASPRDDYYVEFLDAGKGPALATTVGYGLDWGSQPLRTIRLAVVTPLSFVSVGASDVVVSSCNHDCKRSAGVAIRI